MPTPTPSGNESSERSPETTAPRRARRRRTSPRFSACPYNLRSKRRRLFQNFQSNTTSLVAETGQASTASVQQEGQTAPRVANQTSAVRDSQSDVEQLQGTRSDESRRGNEEEAAMAKDAALDEVTEAELVDVCDGEEDQINNERSADLSDGEVILVSHTQRGQAPSIQARASTVEEPNTTGTAAGVTCYVEPKFVLEEYRPVFCWRYKTNEPHCVICMENLESFCPSCQELGHQLTLSDPNCKLTWGKCSHVFHDHCLHNWFARSNNNSCPLDRQVFEVDHTV